MIEQFAYWVCFGEWPMKKIIKLRSKMICSAVVALSMALPGLTHAQILFSQKNETSAKVLQQHLLQERSLAGLKSKTLKIGEVTWSYSEGGA